MSAMPVGGIAAQRVLADEFRCEHEVDVRSRLPRRQRRGREEDELDDTVGERLLAFDQQGDLTLDGGGGGGRHRHKITYVSLVDKA